MKYIAEGDVAVELTIARPWIKSVSGYMYNFQYKEIFVAALFPADTDTNIGVTYRNWFYELPFCVKHQLPPLYP